MAATLPLRTAVGGGALEVQLNDLAIRPSFGGSVGEAMLRTIRSLIAGSRCWHNFASSTGCDSLRMLHTLTPVLTWCLPTGSTNGLQSAMRLGAYLPVSTAISCLHFRIK